jgi:hypothetical protein
MTHQPALPAEFRPRDFSAKLTRRAHGIGVRPRRRHYGRRATVLLAAVAVPAFAAPSEWSAFEIGNAGRAEVAVEPMPFEQPGSSFPGSAFYYLAPDAPSAPLVAGVHSDGEDPPLADSPAARAMRIDNSGIDRSRALQCMTAAIYYEAASESDSGQRAVAQVVLNRVAHPSYPGTVCGVVFQGSERSTGCQFSFTCDGSLRRVPNRLFWQRAENVARDALSGFVYAPVGLATHYHTIAIHPYWAPSLRYLLTIGAHRFYSFKGPAGRPAAFSFAYLGGEPAAAPHARDPRADLRRDPALDPVAIEKAYAAGFKAAVVPAANGLTPVRSAPAPVYAPELQQRGGEALYRGEKLPEATGIRPEYQNSGQWIARPAS